VTATLYDAIGGRDMLVTLVDGLYERLVVDTTVRHHFSAERLPSLKEAQVLWFEAVLQGQEPPGDLRAIHAHLDIADDDINAVIGHLDAVLGELGTDHRVRRGIVALISRLWHARDF
jgi:hemoglobin